MKGKRQAVQLTEWSVRTRPARGRRRREMGHVFRLLIAALLSPTRAEWDVAFTITPSIPPACEQIFANRDIFTVKSQTNNFNAP